MVDEEGGDEDEEGEEEEEGEEGGEEEGEEGGEIGREGAKLIFTGMTRIERCFTLIR